MKKVIFLSVLLLTGCSKLPQEEKELASKKVDECNNAYIHSLYEDALRQEKEQNAKFALFRSYGLTKLKYQEVIDAECTENLPIKANENDIMKKLQAIERKIEDIREKLDYIR